MWRVLQRIGVLFSIARGVFWLWTSSAVLTGILVVTAEYLSFHWRSLSPISQGTAVIAAFLVILALLTQAYVWVRNRQQGRSTAAMIHRLVNDPKFRYVESEATKIERAQGRERHRKEVADLRRACIVAFETTEQWNMTADGPERAREALAALRIEREAVGAPRLGETYAALRLLDEQLGGLIGVRFLGPGAGTTPLAEARATKGKIVGTLDVWLRRIH
jgi:hypothetical protein